MPVTVNQLVVSMIVWVVGFVLKKIPNVPNDMIPQLLYYVSLVSAYLIEVLKGLGAAPAEAQVAAATDSTPVANPAIDGTVAWVLTNIWDWIGRKLILEKLLKRKP